MGTQLQCSHQPSLIWYHPNVSNFNFHKFSVSMTFAQKLLKSRHHTRRTLHWRKCMHLWRTLKPPEIGSDYTVCLFIQSYWFRLPKPVQSLRQKMYFSAQLLIWSGNWKHTEHVLFHWLVFLNSLGRSNTSEKVPGIIIQSFSSANYLHGNVYQLDIFWFRSHFCVVPLPGLRE